MATAGASQKRKIWSINDEFKVTVTKNYPENINANLELQWFVSPNPKAELRYGFRKRKRVVYFPVPHRKYPRPRDILKETFRKCVKQCATKDRNCVLMPIDDLKCWKKRFFCEVILEEFIDLSGKQKVKLNRFVKLVFCSMEDHNFGEAMKALEAKIKEVKPAFQNDSITFRSPICILRDNLANVRKFEMEEKKYDDSRRYLSREELFGNPRINCSFGTDSLNPYAGQTKEFEMEEKKYDDSRFYTRDEIFGNPRINCSFGTDSLNPYAGQTKEFVTEQKKYDHSPVFSTQQFGTEQRGYNSYGNDSFNPPAGHTQEFVTEQKKYDHSPVFSTQQFGTEQRGYNSYGNDSFNPPAGHTQVFQLAEKKYDHSPVFSTQLFGTGQTGNISYGNVSLDPPAGQTQVFQIAEKKYDHPPVFSTQLFGTGQPGNFSYGTDSLNPPAGQTQEFEIAGKIYDHSPVFPTQLFGTGQTGNISYGTDSLNQPAGQTQGTLEYREKLPTASDDKSDMKQMEKDLEIENEKDTAQTLGSARGDYSPFEKTCPKSDTQRPDQNVGQMKSFDMSETSKEKSYQVKKVGKFWLVGRSGGKLRVCPLLTNAEEVVKSDNFIVADDNVYEIKEDKFEQLYLVSVDETPIYNQNNGNGNSSQSRQEESISKELNEMTITDGKRIGNNDDQYYLFEAGQTEDTSLIEASFPAKQ